MESLTPLQDFARPIARHEFGHYVVAKALKFTVGDVTLRVNPPQEHHGTSAIEPATAITTVKDIRHYLEKRTSVLYAGSLAESLSSGQVNQERANAILKTTATQDYAKARELIHLLRSIEHAPTSDETKGNDQLKAIGDRVWGKAIKIIERDAGLIEVLSLALTNRIVQANRTETMTKAEIEAIPEFAKRFRISN